jgi:hypothetical protein
MERRTFGHIIKTKEYHESLHNDEGAQIQNIRRTVQTIMLEAALRNVDFTFIQRFNVYSLTKVTSLGHFPANDLSLLLIF